jgi:hypothetical protein
MTDRSVKAKSYLKAFVRIFPANVIHLEDYHAKAMAA